MSNPVHMQSFLDSQVSFLSVTDEVLNEWNGEGCLQFPTLMGTISSRLGWDNKQTRENEPIIRKYIRNHPDWHVTRGAHGGIMKASEKQKKDSIKAAKEQAKADVAAALEAEIARKQAEAVNNTPVSE